MPHTKNKSNRLVDYKTTESIVNKVKDRVEDLKKTEDNQYDNILSVWKFFRSGLLIPENMQDDNLTVHDNYSLLKPNHILSYDQALFLLLGLNALTFDKHPVWYNFTLYKKDLHSADINHIERVFYDSPQNMKLKHSIYATSGEIYSENLITLAKDNGFFTHEGLSYIDTLFSKKNYKDPGTKIPINRLEIYKETLPKFLSNLEKPLSIRALALRSDEQTDGKYTKEYKSRLRVGGPTIRKEISQITTTYWWKNQPSEIQRKIKGK